MSRPPDLYVMNPWLGEEDNDVIPTPDENKEKIVVVKLVDYFYVEMQVINSNMAEDTAYLCSMLPMGRADLMI